MMEASIREDLLQALPYARRYARALTGSQARGDVLVAESLRELAAAPISFGDPRYGLYAGITQVFDRQRSARRFSPESGAALTQKQRQLLLLTSLEDVELQIAAQIVGLSVGEANEQLAHAREQLRDSAAADVMIIEDEPIIAMEIEELVRGCGHRVVGVASSEEEAVEIARRTQPGLILADVNLGRGGDGSLAVARILNVHETPVIFVTAYPERLLSGVAPEPAFVITKPFDPLMLAIATYQAVTGGVHLE